MRLLPFPLLFLCALSLMTVASTADAQPIYEGDSFFVTDSSVVQEPFRAEAVSRTRIISNYEQEKTAINFKFSLNKRDNERRPGDDRRLRLDPRGGTFLTPVYVFGGRASPEPPEPTRVAPGGNGDSVRVTFRVDLRPVLRRFREQGYYDPPAGGRISADEFEGVYILGDTVPLSWSTDRLDANERLRLTDPDGDGVYRTTLAFARRTVRPRNEQGQAVWSLSADVSDFPTYRSEQPLVDALYNLALEELSQNVRDDGAFMAGKKWTGVWTRDISYSILLSLAAIDPDGAKTSLLHKVTEDGRIIQDTGTGGSWPVSTDRMTWALAAWEVYATTGDDAWLRKSYEIIRRSARRDLKVAFDSTTGLFYGEASFMDWREQSYPDWMAPADIYGSQVLSTNVVHYRTYRILAQMAEALGEDPAEWQHRARRVKSGINEHLWHASDGRYAGYRYGRTFLTRTARTEALGSALVILSGVTDQTRAKRVARSFPVVEFGVPSFWPYIPEIPPYHNAGIWPFVGAYWTWASAAAGNTPGVEHGLASLYRAAALFLTNKENMVAETGHFEGTQINSDRQLWSVAGNLAMVYRVFFGMRFSPDGLRFDPFVPEPYSGTRTLEGFSYREATLDVTMKGYGTRITQITLDGEALDAPRIPADLTGQHDVTILLSGGLPDGSINDVANRYAPPTPTLSTRRGTLQWTSVGGAAAYRVYRNGSLVDTTLRTQRSVSPDSILREYQVQALSPSGFVSFRSEPVRVVSDAGVTTAAPESPLSTEHAGYTGRGYVSISRDENTTVPFQIEIEDAGRFAVDIRYANGHGPVNTDNKCAIRTLQVDGQRKGAVVLPQRGDGAWDDWGYSNDVHVQLDEGTHTLSLVFKEANENMNGRVNAAHVDHLRLTRLSAEDSL